MSIKRSRILSCGVKMSNVKCVQKGFSLYFVDYNTVCCMVYMVLVGCWLLVVGTN